MAVAHDCDLALLTVDDQSFFSRSLSPWNIMADLPQTAGAVVVLGYPEGGDTISFTKGVVSRIEVIPYMHSLVSPSGHAD